MNTPLIQTRPQSETVSLFVTTALETALVAIAGFLAVVTLVATV
jgi:hypothetical protein